MGEELLAPFELYGWKPDNALTDDTNFMDLTLIVTRSSKCKQGHMACILVHPREETEELCDDDDAAALTDTIIGVANNHELFKPKQSDVHAEIAAIGQAARAGRATEGCTAYVTMPPCKNCLGALVAAGVSRVVSYTPPRTTFQSLMDNYQITMVCVEDWREMRARIDSLISSHKHGESTPKDQESSSTPSESDIASTEEEDGQ